MTDRFPASHAQHDLLLIAALAAGDVDASDRPVAESLVAACPECAILASDLRSIAAATAALPARARPRDFAIQPEDAARLRRRGWRRFVAAFGSGSPALRPLATGLTTLGIAGLLLAALPTIQLGGAATMLAPVGGQPSSSAVPAAAPSVAERDTTGDSKFGPAGSPAPSQDTTEYSAQSGDPDALPVRGPEASPAALDNAAGEDGRTHATPSAQPAAPADSVRDARAASPLVVLSGTFLILGLGLFGLRWTARRLGDG